MHLKKRYPLIHKISIEFDRKVSLHNINTLTARYFKWKIMFGIKTLSYVSYICILGSEDFEGLFLFKINPLNQASLFFWRKKEKERPRSCLFQISVPTNSTFMFYFVATVFYENVFIECCFFFFSHRPLFFFCRMKHYYGS